MHSNDLTIVIVTFNSELKSKMKRLMDSLSINRSLARMSHEILEENNNSKN